MTLRVVFSTFFRQACQVTCRNFELDQNSAELDKDLGELDKNSAELDRKNLAWLCELASVSWNTLKEYFSSFEISHYICALCLKVLKSFEMQFCFSF